MILILAFGTPTAYWIATRTSRLRDVVVTWSSSRSCCRPPSPGIGLLAAFGRLGLLGGTIEALGIDIAFTQTAVVLAVTFVASPFYVRTAVAAFESVDPTLPAAARTLGAGPGRVFVRVALPLAAGGLGAGAALAFARGIGEFGATIMFAGSLQGRRRRSRSRSTSSSTSTSTSRSRSAPCSSSSAAPCCCPSSCSPDGAPHRLHPFPSRLRRPRRADGRRAARRSRSSGRRARGRRRRCGSSPASCGRTAASSRSTTRRGSTRRGGSTSPPEHRRVGLPVPGVRALPAPRRLVERPLRRATRHVGQRAARPVPDRRTRPGPRAGALGRRAPAGRARTRARPASGDAAARRAALGARRPHEGGGPLRAPRAAARARAPDDARHARLRGRGRARRPDRRDRRRAASCRRDRRATSSRRPRDAFVASLTGASLLRGIARAGGDGLTEIVLDDGGSAWSTDEADGARRRRRPPLGGLARHATRPTTRR